MEHSAVCIRGVIIVGYEAIVGYSPVAACAKSACLDIGGLNRFKEGPLLFIEELYGAG